MSCAPRLLVAHAVANRHAPRQREPGGGCGGAACDSMQEARAVSRLGVQAQALERRARTSRQIVALAAARHDNHLCALAHVPIGTHEDSGAVSRRPSLRSAAYLWTRGQQALRRSTMRILQNQQGSQRGREALHQWAGWVLCLAGGPGAATEPIRTGRQGYTVAHSSPLRNRCRILQNSGAVSDPMAWRTAATRR